MSFQGKVKDITIVPSGAELDQPTLATDTVLYLNSIDDFDEDGGSVAIGLDVDGNPNSPVTYLSVLETDDPGVDAEGVTNPPICTMTLATPVGAVWEEGTKVFLYPFSDEKIAQVMLTGIAEETVECRVPHHLEILLTDGIREEGNEETVIVDTDSTGDLTIVSVVGQQVKLQGSYIVDVPQPDSDGEPPAQVGGLTARGGIRTVLLEWEPVQNYDLVTYNIYGSTQSGFVTDGTTKLGETGGAQFFAKQVWDPVSTSFVDLVPETTYYFVVSASDEDGEGLDSSEVEGSPIQVNTPDIATNSVTTDALLANSITADKFAASLALLSQLFVGSRISILPTDSSPGAADNGIMITTDNGGKIRFPADGTTAQLFKVAAELTEVLIQDNLELRGALNQILGTLSLGIGAGTPTTGPTVVDWWSASLHSLAITGAPNGTDKLIGLCDNGTSWLVCDNTPGDQQILSIDKTTGAATVVSTYHNSLPPSSSILDIAKVGTDFYVQVSLAGSSGGARRIDKFNASWVYQSTWTTNLNPGDRFVAGLDSDGGGFLWMSAEASDFRARLYRFNPDGTGGQVNASSSIADYEADIDYLFVGNADFGTQRWVTGMTSYREIRVRPSTGGGTANKISSNTFKVAGSSYHKGIAWDGSNFHTLNNDGRIWKYMTHTTAQTRSVRYSLFDSDAGGTGTHETAWSPATPFTQKARTPMKVSAPAPSDNGGSDDPDKLRFYIQNGGAGSYYRQADVSSPWWAIYGTPSTAGATAVSTPDFTGVVNPGAIKSKAEKSAGVPHIWIKGDGGWRLTGPNETEQTFTPGWASSAGGGLSIGSGTLTGSKRYIGDFVIANVILIRASDSNQGGAGSHYYFTIGETFPSLRMVQGHGWIRDASTATDAFCWVRAINSTTLVLLTATGGTRLGNAVPWTWAADDEICFEVRAKITV